LYAELGKERRDSVVADRVGVLLGRAILAAAISLQTIPQIKPENFGTYQFTLTAVFVVGMILAIFIFEEAENSVSSSSAAIRSPP
jgi:hypothetical protein